MHYIPFNSRNPLHKNKFGALCSGDEVTLRVVLPREIRCTAVRLVFKTDESPEGRLGLVWERMEGAVEEWWKCTFKPEYPALWWYHFEYDTAFGTSGIFNVGNGLGAMTHEGSDWQLTVYEEDFSTPVSYAGGVIYQIFPDRFNRAETELVGVPEDRILRDDIDGCPEWRPDENGVIRNNDYFCGNLRGIEEKLDYIASLGVTIIYLNPIFEAHSNHRYDTANYFKIDPILGTEEDFVSLCKRASEFGISVILDGVFSHTGADSIYFNKFGRYPVEGAYNSKLSPYYQWYKFKSWPDDYDCWWDIAILPNVDETNDSYLEFITGQDGVIRHWLRLGASGWRLDVTDELPDIFLDRLRQAAKEEKKDSFIIGEVWEDASNKISYSQRRRYLLGRQLDSVMNYPFANAVMDFLRTGVVEGFTDKILTIIENYPPMTLHLLMNHIGTHDTVRAITALAGNSLIGKDRKEQSEEKLTAEQRRMGIKLMMTASAIQFTLPGIPSIYYGDEAGLEGCADPFNRRCYPFGKEDHRLIGWYQKLGKIRKENPCLSFGSFVPISEAEGCLAFARECPGNAILLIANRNTHPITYHLPEKWHGSRVLTGNNEEIGTSVDMDAVSAVILLMRT